MQKRFSGTNLDVKSSDRFCSIISRSNSCNTLNKIRINYEKAAKSTFRKAESAEVNVEETNVAPEI